MVCFSYALSLLYFLILLFHTSTVGSFVDLATTGPSVTVTIGLNGLALVCLYGSTMSNTATANNFIGFVASGANTIAPAENLSVQTRLVDNVTTNAGCRIGATFLLTGLNQGSTTFKMQYKINAGVGHFLDRRITVIPL